MYGRKEAAPKQDKNAAAPPRDALAALMEGNTPDKKDLKFADERTDSFDYGHSNVAQKQPKSGGKFEQYNGDHSFDHRPNRSQGEYGYQPQEASTFNSELSNAMSWIKQIHTCSWLAWYIFYRKLPVRMVVCAMN